MMQKIDLSTAPSAMEKLAASWTRDATKTEMKPSRPTGHSFPKKPLPQVLAPAPRRQQPSVEEQQRRRAEERLPGGRGLDPTEQDLAAYKAYLRSLLAELPDPKAMVFSISEVQREGLRTAFKTPNGWAARPEYVDELRAVGLCSVGGGKGRNLNTHNKLGHFGSECRRVLLDLESKF